MDRWDAACTIPGEVGVDTLAVEHGGGVDILATNEPGTEQRTRRPMNPGQSTSVPYAS